MSLLSSGWPRAALSVPISVAQPRSACLGYNCSWFSGGRISCDVRLKMIYSDRKNLLLLLGVVP